MAQDLVLRLASQKLLNKEGEWGGVGWDGDVITSEAYWGRLAGEIPWCLLALLWSFQSGSVLQVADIHSSLPKQKDDYC